MFYTILFEIIMIIIGFILKLLAFYLMIKYYNKTINLSSIIKPILLYELGAFIYFNLVDISEYGIYFNKIVPISLFIIFYILISIIVLFVFFKFIMEKYNLLSWKKSLAVYLIIFFIAIPSIIYIKSIASKPIMKLSVFEREVQELRKYDLLSLVNMLQGPQKPLPLRITNAINNSLLNGKIISELQLISF